MKYAKWARRNALTLTVLLVAVALAVSTWDFVQVGHQARVTCREVQAVKGAIVVVVRSSLKTLGKKGAPGYAYYRAHPGELSAARRQGQQELDTFKSRAC